jgi:NAD(P)-dependent dehydrogenase (short-subunit alcohol dehydrogenase family)
LQSDVGCSIWVRMDLQLRGKRAIVTGSTAGIGLAIAIDLAREGATVVVNGRTQGRVDAALAQIRGEVREARVEGVAADLGSAAGARLVTARASDTDILVNNVGIFESVPFEQIDDASWLRLFETNVLSGVRLSRHYFPRMLRQGWGRVLFISSESALQIPSEMIHYGVTKTAQLSLARGLAELTAGTQVTVNSVLPGPTRSEGVGAFVEGLARQQRKDAAEVEREFFRHMRPSSLLQRFAEPAEVAHLVAFLASPLASGTNGAALRVDGGVVRAIV